LNAAGRRSRFLNICGAIYTRFAWGAGAIRQTVDFIHKLDVTNRARRIRVFTQWRHPIRGRRRSHEFESIRNAK